LILVLTPATVITTLAARSWLGMLVPMMGIVIDDARPAARSLW
jgi:hypothetical protein